MSAKRGRTRPATPPHTEDERIQTTDLNDTEPGNTNTLLLLYNKGCGKYVGVTVQVMIIEKERFQRIEPMCESYKYCVAFHI